MASNPRIAKAYENLSKAGKYERTEPYLVSVLVSDYKILEPFMKATMRRFYTLPDGLDVKTMAVESPVCEYEIHDPSLAEISKHGRIVLAFKNRIVFTTSINRLCECINDYHYYTEEEN